MPQAIEPTELIKVPGKSMTERVVGTTYIAEAHFPKAVSVRFIDRVGENQPAEQVSMHVSIAHGRPQEDGDSLHYYEHLKIQQLRNMFPNIGSGAVEVNGSVNTSSIHLSIDTNRKQDASTIVGVLEALGEPIPAHEIHDLGQHAYIASEMGVARERIKSVLRERQLRQLVAHKSPAYRTAHLNRYVNVDHYAHIQPEEIQRIQNRVLSSPVTITVVNAGPVLRERILNLANNVSKRRRGVVENKVPKPSERYLQPESRLAVAEVGESPENVTVSFLIPKHLVAPEDREDVPAFTFIMNGLLNGEKAIQRESARKPPGFYWGHAFVDDDLQAFVVGAEVPFEQGVEVGIQIAKQVFQPDAYRAYIAKYGWDAILGRIIDQEKRIFANDPTRAFYWLDIVGELVDIQGLEKIIRSYTEEQFLAVMDNSLRQARMRSSIAISSPTPKIHEMEQKIKRLRENGLFLE